MWQRCGHQNCYMSVVSSDNSTASPEHLPSEHLPSGESSPEAAQPEADPPREMSTTRSFDWVFLILAILIVSLSFLLSRESDGVGVSVPGVFRLPSICMTKNVFGLDCPGCGLTRSFISLVGGDLWASLQANPAGFAYFLLIVGQIPYRGWIILRRFQGRSYQRIGNWPLFVVAGALILQWMLRGLYATFIYYAG